MTRVLVVNHDIDLADQEVEFPPAPWLRRQGVPRPDRGLVSDPLALSRASWQRGRMSSCTTPSRPVSPRVPRR